MIKHYFEFISSGRGRKEIGEPEGFDGATFDIIQRLHGRDVTYAGGKSAFRIYKDSQLYYAWDDVMYEMDIYGYNAEIRYIIDFHGEFVQIGEVDLGENRKTDGKTYLEFNVVEENIYTLFKKRFDMNYDILSERTVDNAYISPAPTSSILLYSLPQTAISKWTNPVIGKETFHDNPSQNADYFNVIKNVTQSEIKNTLSWLDDSNTDDNGGFKNFKLVNALDKLQGVTIQMNYNIRYDYLPTRNNNLDNHAGQILLRVYVGQSEQQGQYQQYNVWSSTAFTGNTDQTQNVPTSLTLTIPFIDRTENIWISFVSATNNGAVNKVTFFECETIITASAVGYNSIIKGVRLFDAMKKCALGVSNNDINAPRWFMSGRFFNQFITTQDLMRNLVDKPFYLSNKFISEDYLPEVNGDYEIQKDARVFYGIETDFYTNQEIAVFDHEPTEDFDLPINPDLYCNQFNYRYKNYQSQKEIEEQNSGDIVHGEKQTSYPGKRSQNTKDVNVGVIRDPVLIEVMRRKALEISKDTVTQDDKKVVILDCINNTENRQFTERALLKHSRIDDTTLVLNSVVISSGENGNETLNSGDPNFLSLGILPGTLFLIDTGVNSGGYNVVSVNGSEIRLTRTTQGAVVDNDGVNTTFFYVIRISDVPYVIRTIEGFNEVSGFAAPARTANLMYTVQRNIQNFYNEFNASNLFYSEDKTIRTRLYYNNPDGVTVINGNYVREGDDFTATSPVLTPRLIKTQLLCNLQQWEQLKTTIRLNRGFIRILDAEGLPLRGYLQEGKWSADTSKPTNNSNYDGKADVILKERYFPTRLTVESVQEGTILINNTIMPSGFSFKVNDITGKLTIFDAVGKRLNIPVIFKEISINGVTPANIDELRELMESL